MRKTKPFNYIMEVDIVYDIFQDSYNQKYLKAIDSTMMGLIQAHFDIPYTDKLKKNGTFKRNLVFTVSLNLVSVMVRIQTLLWSTASGERHYISVFPNFIIKYNPLTIPLIELISSNVRKDEDIFNHLNDPENLFDSETELAHSCLRVEHACKNKMFAAILNSRFTNAFNTIAHIEPPKNTRYPEICTLIAMAKLFFTSPLQSVLTLANKYFHFLC